MVIATISAGWLWTIFLGSGVLVMWQKGQVKREREAAQREGRPPARWAAEPPPTARTRTVGLRIGPFWLGSSRTRRGR